PFEPFGQRGGAARVAGNHEDRIVAANRADRFGELRAIDGKGERLRLADAGPDDNQVLDVLDALEKLGGGALERDQRRGGADTGAPGPLVGAIARALDEAELLDVARNGRLRGVEAAALQTLAQLLLAVECVTIDEI